LPGVEQRKGCDLMRRFVVLLVVVGLLLAAGVAQADWKVTNPLRSWDDDFGGGAGRWENGNMSMYLDGTAQPFYNEISGQFDTDVVTDACGTGSDTRYAGDKIIDLYHVDVGLTLAQANGFLSTGNWKLVSCTAVEAATKYPPAGATLATCTADNGDAIWDRCEIVGQDAPDTTMCGGNCAYVIYSTIKINLDTNCDGSLDTGFGSDVCLYFEAEKPLMSPPYWNGNIQARLQQPGPGGDKTDNFAILGPNAVTFLGLQAVPGALAAPAMLGVVALGALLAGGAALVFRRHTK
jgi:hypothetical protein